MIPHSKPNPMVLYQCSVAGVSHRMLLCYPIGDGKVTVYCKCDAPMQVVPLNPEVVYYLCLQYMRDGQNSVLATISDEKHAGTKSFFVEERP
jgi:hypothetical protein